MLSSPTRPSLERHQSFENTTPCPPYNHSQEDLLSVQKAAVVMAPSPASIASAVPDEDEIWAEFERIQDPMMLKEKFYEQHQHMRAQLDMAGRYGLSLQQDVEELQDAQVQSYAQIQSLQDENSMLKTRAHHAMDLSSQLSGSENEVRTLTTHNESLQRELDGCRKDLKSFRRELDSLVEQMTEMGSEVLDAKTKVSVYARRLTEVEQELSVTKEANVDLQVQLQTALDKQKQSQSSTAQVVKNIQSDLGKVLSDSGTIRSTLEELENRQVKCEDKVVEMMTNTKEYAHLLEEAQETIQTLRIESDMEGRGWAHQSPQTANWGYQARKSSSQLSTSGLEGDSREFSPHELDPNGWDHSIDDNGASNRGAQSLGMELGLGMTMHTEEWDRSQSALETQPKGSNISSPPSTPASYLCSAADSKHLTPATSPLAPSAFRNEKMPGPPPQPVQEQQPEQQPLVQKQQQPTPPMIHVPRKLSNASTSLTSELQLRLEEHTNLQTVLASPLSTATGGSSRPPWNPSVALENMLPSPTQQRSSRSTSRAASFSSRSSSRSVSLVNLQQLSSPGSSAPFRNGSSTSSTSSVTYQFLNHHQHPMMPSPQTSPHSASMPTSSLMDAIASQQGRSLLQNTASNNTSSNSSNHNRHQGASNTGSRPRSRTAAMTVERNLTPSGSSDLLSVTAKTKAKAQGSSSPTFNTSSRAANRGRSGAMGGGSSSPVPPEKPRVVQRSRASSTANPTTSHHQQQQQARRAAAEANRTAAAPPGSPIPRGTAHSRKTSTVAGGAGKAVLVSSTPPPARPSPASTKITPPSPPQKRDQAVVEPAGLKEGPEEPGQEKVSTEEISDLRPSAFSPVPVLLPLPEEAAAL
ncbi:hypothetical protein EMPS_01398 [Entomortierella parvispora]|uniref:Uncharacterized protein n=1 Tax=Entomortierella parvispora TaxID=205924 RepID=A0A9P3LSS0_9FUNG|nr:hypothetical protein EMPS_01398 [Entomortierella parvispora]